jgi:hypothetical protein
MSEKRESRIRGMTSSREKALKDMWELKISGKTRLDQVLEVKFFILFFILISLL